MNLFSSRYPGDRIERVKVVEFEAEFVRDAILGKNFGNKAVNGDAAHRANMDAPRERFFSSRIINVVPLRGVRVFRISPAIPIGPEHERIVSR